MSEKVQKFGALWALVFVMVSALAYVLLRGDRAANAELAVSLRANGETVHATVASRSVQTSRRNLNQRHEVSHVYQLTLVGALASGANWSSVEIVGPREYDEHVEGTSVEIRVLSAEPTRWRRSSWVDATDPHGYPANSGATLVLTSLGLGLFAATFVGLLVAIVARRRGRSA